MELAFGLHGCVSSLSNLCSRSLMDLTRSEAERGRLRPNKKAMVSFTRAPNARPVTISTTRLYPNSSPSRGMQISTLTILVADGTPVQKWFGGLDSGQVVLPFPSDLPRSTHMLDDDHDTRCSEVWTTAVNQATHTESRSAVAVVESINRCTRARQRGTDKAFGLPCRS